MSVGSTGDGVSDSRGRPGARGLSVHEQVGGPGGVVAGTHPGGVARKSGRRRAGTSSWTTSTSFGDSHRDLGTPGVPGVSVVDIPA